MTMHSQLRVCRVTHAMHTYGAQVLFPRGMCYFRLLAAYPPSHLASTWFELRAIGTFGFWSELILRKG